MEQNELVYSGILLLPPAGKILLKKTWQQKHCLLFKASKFGIERLEVYDSQDVSKATPSRIITLENCIKITSSSPTHFTVTTKSSPCIYEFGALSTQAKNEWMGHLQSVAFPDDVSLMTSMQEDNDLYCSSGEGIFHVRIHSSAASDRCGLDTKTLYTLLLTQTAMQLRNLNDCNLLYTWPYRYIRRYGYKGGKFTFEAGRMCDSGEGTFYLLHSNQQEIFRCLASKMKTMKKMLREDSSSSSNPASSSSILDFGAGENQFHAAMSMEARSRSPLPPSPTTLRDVEASISNATLFEDSSFSSSSTVASIKQKLSQAKPAKPSKPPRKNLVKPQPPPPLQQSDQNKIFADSANAYEPIDKYDRVEYRSDAWRTMGVNEIKHTENVGEEDEEYMSWGHKPSAGAAATTNFVPPASRTPKILTNPPVTPEEDPNYDKLNFFGSSRQLNVKSGYKQIAMGAASAVPCPPSFNDYDEVQPGIEGIRLADDSHLGYALIRKEPPKETVGNAALKAAADDAVSHQFHNNEPYAMISKPKRV